GSIKSATTNREGGFEISDLTPGDYSLVVTAANFEPYENAKVSITPGRQLLDVTLNVASLRTNVQVESRDPLGAPETGAHGGGVVLRENELDVLPDNPEDLAAALQALAGPSA